MCALLFLEWRRVRSQIMANIWMVPQGRVHFPMCGWNFVTKSAWPGCWSISLSLPARSSVFCHPSLPVMNRAAMRNIFHDNGPSSTFVWLSLFPFKVLLPLLWQREIPQPVHKFPNIDLAAGGPAGLLHSASVPCSTVYFGYVIEWGYEFQHRSELRGDIREKGRWDSLLLPMLYMDTTEDECQFSAPSHR